MVGKSETDEFLQLCPKSRLLTPRSVKFRFDLKRTSECCLQCISTRQRSRKRKARRSVEFSRSQGRASAEPESLEGQTP
eukprot:6199770-Pleurochrysis_carterae.AAC.6